MPNSIFGTFSLPSATGEKVTLYQLSKDSLETTDQSLLDTITDPHHGSIAVITTTIDNKEYQKSSYMYDTNAWVALNGNVEADKVILTDDILMAGDYTQVGNWSKGKTDTKTQSTKGKSLSEALQMIFTKELQPTKTNPSIGNVSINASTSVEVGTKIASVTVSAVTTNAGAYTYGPATGVTFSDWKTYRITSAATTELSDVGAGGAVTDNNGGDGFVIGDSGSDITSLKYKVSTKYSDGVVAKTNLGNNSNPEVKITGSSLEKTSSEVTAYRKYFYGSTTDVIDPTTLTSAKIRALTQSTAKATKGTKFDINVVEGAKTVIIACLGIDSIASVADKNAFGTDIVASFKKFTVDVEGANGYTAKTYNVFVYSPDAALGENTYNVTL